MLKINKDKTSQKVTKDPKRQKRDKKSHETYMKRLKEKILEDNQLPPSPPMDKPTPSTPTPTDRPTPSTSSSSGDPTSSATSHTTRSSDIYVYGVGILPVLAIGVCVFFAYNSQAKNKKQSNEKKINRQNDVIYFFGLKTTNVKPPKASLDAMDILKLAGGICGEGGGWGAGGGGYW